MKWTTWFARILLGVILLLICAIEFFDFDIQGTYMILLSAALLCVLHHALPKSKRVSTQEMFDWPMTSSRKRRRKPRTKE